MSASFLSCEGEPLKRNVRCFTIMTRLLLLLTISGFAIPTLVRAQAITGLQLTTEILSQRYCTGDGDLDGVLLDLRLLYRNTGTVPLILYKDSFHAGTTEVLKTVEGPSELYYAPDEVPANDNKPWTVDASSLDKRFVILQANATFETKSTTRVFVTRDDSKHFAGSVESGDHYLLVTISTWPGSQEQADQMQREWRSNGTLWRTAITSLPMKFTIAKNRTVSDCP